MAVTVKEVEGYRLRSLYDGSYTIEKYRDGDWKLCFGVERGEGLDYLSNPDAIERQVKHYRRTGWFILGVFVVSVLGILFLD